MDVLLVVLLVAATGGLIGGALVASVGRWFL